MTLSCCYVQVELVLDIEEKLPPMRRWVHIGHAVAYPNQTNVVTKFLQSDSQQVDNIQNALAPHMVSPIALPYTCTHVYGEA